MAAALTEDLVLHAGADGLLGLLAGHGNGDALAQSQAVSLDHGGDGGRLEIGQRLVHVVKDGVLGGGNVVFLHEVLGEDLAALQNGGSLVGAEAGNADGFQPVHRAQDQGIVGGNDREINGVVLGEGGNGVQIFRPDAGADGVGGDAAVAGGGENFRNAGALFQALDDGVLPSAAAYYENLHGN